MNIYTYTMYYYYIIYLLLAIQGTSIARGVSPSKTSATAHIELDIVVKL